MFLIELTRNIHTRLTTGGHYDPVWSPDSREVAFVSEEACPSGGSINARRRRFSIQESWASKIGRTTAVS